MRGEARTILILTLLAAGCGARDNGVHGDGSWVGTVATEGSVTTVVNESGSVWSGAATLVEEASIGVETGPDEYMFGNVVGVAANDKAIFVLDPQVPTVRVHDYDGHYLRDIGREGDGPGEFRNPRSVAVAADGRLFVKEQARIGVFSPEGEPLGTWPVNTGFSSGTPMVMTVDGVLYFHDLTERGNDITEWQHGMRAVGPDGVYGEPVRVPHLEYPPYQLITRFPGGGMTSFTIPFSAGPVWAMAPSGAMIAGVPSDYRFEVHFPDGSVTVVEKTWEPVPVERDEAKWNRARITANQRRNNPDWSWDGPPIPDKKPAYSQLAPDHSGRIWVKRIVRTEDVPECDPNPLRPAGERPRSCWRQVYGVEVFDAESGRYLGQVEEPPATSGLSRIDRAFIKDDTVIIRVDDEAGTIMVKRYRLILPGSTHQ
ncbi:MAG: 6-bladed beta-propeller [Acidobacteriota bacterium]